MADKTKIEWTDASWTPVRAQRKATVDAIVRSSKVKFGWHCEHVSEGCRNCYAQGMNKRLGTGLDFKPGHRKDIELFLDEKMLTAPLRWKKPRRIFVCSMTDLFADFVKDEWIDRMFAVMALCPQHTFQILTKRPERMRKYFERMAAPLQDNDWGRSFSSEQNAIARLYVAAQLNNWFVDCPGDGCYLPNRVKTWPLPNVWLGTSCEDQTVADARIPHLLATPAAIRFLSCEPLLGPIDLRYVADDGITEHNALSGEHLFSDVPQGTKIDWVIAGGESGREARPMHPDWARSLRDQCDAAGVPFFFKQWGEWVEFTRKHFGIESGPSRWRAVFPDGRVEETNVVGPKENPHIESTDMIRVGKAKAGRTLDGKIHDGYPAVQE